MCSRNVHTQRLRSDISPTVRCAGLQRVKLKLYCTSDHTSVRVYTQRGDCSRPWLAPTCLRRASEAPQYSTDRGHVATQAKPPDLVTRDHTHSCPQGTLPCLCSAFQSLPSASRQQLLGRTVCCASTAECRRSCKMHAQHRWQWGHARTTHLYSDQPRTERPLALAGVASASPKRLGPGVGRQWGSGECHRRRLQPVGRARPGRLGSNEQHNRYTSRSRTRACQGRKQRPSCAQARHHTRKWGAAQGNDQFRSIPVRPSGRTASPPT